MVSSSKNFQNGRIYRILNHVDNDIYVGSTTQTLSKRMAWHRGDATKPKRQHIPLYAKMKEHGVGNFYIELIEAYPCENLEQLRMREGHYIREQGTLNKVVAGRTLGEWRETLDKETVKLRQKGYYEANRERRLEQRKEYYVDNREAILQQKHEYYEQNKENKLAKDRERYERNKDAILQKLKAYYTANREQLLERRRARDKTKQTQTSVKTCPRLAA